MPLHLTLLADAVQEYLDAFGEYRALQDSTRGAAAVHRAAKCVRGLYLSVEKVLKHSLVVRDQYLVVERLDPKLLAALVRDRIARPVPTLLCSRQPFETISAARAWELARSELLASLDNAELDSFARAFSKLCELRHRAQHGELYENVEEIVETVELVLRGTRSVLGECAPEFLERCYRRNGQLESRLVALEQKIDGAWSVFTSYLAKRRDPLSVAMNATVYLESDGSQRIFFFKDAKGPRADLTVASAVPAGNATGLFALMLSPEGVQERELQRSAVSQGMPIAQSHSSTSTMSLLGLKRLSDIANGPLVPLDVGKLTLPPSVAWLSLHLPRVRQRSLSIRFVLYNLVLEFTDPNGPAGTIKGFMLPPSFSDPDHVPYVWFGGELRLKSETVFEPDPTRNFVPGGATIRDFNVQVTFAKPGVTQYQRKADSPR